MRQSIEQLNAKELKDSNKALQLELYPQELAEHSELENAVKKRLETTQERCNKLKAIVGVNDISSTFTLSAPLYQIATKVKHELELTDNRYSSSRGNFSILMEEFNDIDKTLKEYQNDFHKEQIFGQKEIEQVG